MKKSSDLLLLWNQCQQPWVRVQGNSLNDYRIYDKAWSVVLVGRWLIQVIRLPNYKVKVTHAVLVLMPNKSKWEQRLFEDLGVYSQSFRCFFSSSRFGHNSDDASHISILLHGQVFVRHGMVVHPLLVLMMSNCNSDQSLFEDFGVHLQMFKCLFWSHFGALFATIPTTNLIFGYCFMVKCLSYMGRLYMLCRY